MSNKMSPSDEELIRKASLKATGADIHEVNSLIGMYNITLELLSKENSLNNFDRKYARIRFGELAVILAMYVDGLADIKTLRDKYLTPEGELQIIVKNKLGASTND